MKTAISLPDDLFQAADNLAERLGVSRSRLYVLALAEYLSKHELGKVTEQLDAVYGAGSHPLDPAVRRTQRRTQLTGSMADW